MTDLLTMVATPAWAYVALFGLLFVDAYLPVIPTQAIMITAGALCAYGWLDIVPTIAVGALAMFGGDLSELVPPSVAGRLEDAARR